MIASSRITLGMTGHQTEWLGTIAWPSPLLVVIAIALVFLGAWLFERFLRQRAADDLDATRERIDLAVASANLGLWEWRYADDLIWLSDRCRDVLGITKKGKIPRSLFLENIHPDDRPEFERSFQALLPDQPQFEIETRVLLGETKELRWVASRGRAHFDPTGQMDRLFGASIDCTARRNAQSIAEQQRDQIAHLTRVATLGQLTGSLAHEITQPLAAILSNAQAAMHHLRSGLTHTGELNSIISDIIADDRRASEIVHRLRSMVRKSAPQFANVAPLEVVQEMVRLMHSELIQRGITLTLESKPGLRAIRADRVQLQQVLLNLLINATDAVTGKPPPQRVIEVVAEPEEDSMVKISIGDHGPGFTPAQLSTVFEPFQSTKPQGLGIGLWISRMIMESHGGKILLANRPEGGALATMLLPSTTNVRVTPSHA
jgi:signal transduction histidine kinase